MLVCMQDGQCRGEGQGEAHNDLSTVTYLHWNTHVNSACVHMCINYMQKNDKYAVLHPSIFLHT